MCRFGIGARCTNRSPFVCVKMPDGQIGSNKSQFSLWISCVYVFFLAWCWRATQHTYNRTQSFDYILCENREKKKNSAPCAFQRRGSHLMCACACACSTHIITIFVIIVCPLTMATINTTTATVRVCVCASLCQLLHHLDKFTCSHDFHLREKTWVTQWRTRKQRRVSAREIRKQSTYRVAVEHVAFRRNAYYRLGRTKNITYLSACQFHSLRYILYIICTTCFVVIRISFCFISFWNFRSVFGIPTNWLWL